MEIGDCREVWREEGWGWVFQSFEGRLWGWPLEGDLEWVEGVFNKRVGFRVRNCRRVRFSMDRWYEKDPLVVAFLELFFIASNKDAWVD